MLKIFFNNYFTITEWLILKCKVHLSKLYLYKMALRIPSQSKKLDIKRGGIGISLSGLTPPHLCACPKPRHEFPTFHFIIDIYFIWYQESEVSSDEDSSQSIRFHYRSNYNSSHYVRGPIRSTTKGWRSRGHSWFKQWNYIWHSTYNICNTIIKLLWKPNIKIEY